MSIFLICLNYLSYISNLLRNRVLIKQYIFVTWTQSYVSRPFDGGMKFVIRPGHLYCDATIVAASEHFDSICFAPRTFQTLFAQVNASSSDVLFQLGRDAARQQEASPTGGVAPDQGSTTRTYFSQHCLLSKTDWALLSPRTGSNIRSRGWLSWCLR